MVATYDRDLTAWARDTARRRKIEDSPSLTRYPEQVLEKEYQRACRVAGQYTKLDVSTFAIACPYAIEKVLGDWLPE